MRTLAAFMLVPVLAGMLAAQQAPPAATSPKTAGVAAEDYYAACMDTAAIAERGTQPLGPALQAIAAVRNPYQLAGPVAALHRVGVGTLFHLGAGTAPAAPADNAGNRQHLTALFERLGDSRAAAVIEARAALQVGWSLDQARQRLQALRQPLSHTALARLVPNFDWSGYFDALGTPPATLRGNPAYLQALNGRLLTVALADWKSYLRWQWLNVGAPLLPPDFAREHAALLGLPPPSQRAAMCHAAVRRYTPQQLLAARIVRDDYFGDTMRLRAALSRSAKR